MNETRTWCRQGSSAGESSCWSQITPECTCAGQNADSRPPRLIRRLAKLLQRRLPSVILDTKPCDDATLVVPKLDRLARSVPDARHIADQLQAKGVKLALGRNIHDPGDPMGKMFFNILATFAEFEVDLIRMRTREGMAIARAKGKLRGKQPKLSEKQQRELCRMHATGDYSIGDLAEVFAVSRPTVYRTLSRAAASS